MHSDTLSRDARIRGALLGLQAGDALAMPVHWYYDRLALNMDYGHVSEYLAPKNPHPDSILWRSQWTAPRPELDILHDQRQYWGQQGVHYHQFLPAGQVTLTGSLCALAAATLAGRNDYDAHHWAEAYIAFMTTPHSHNDTYVEECHRGFFTNLGAGRNPLECGVQEKHIGGLGGPLTVALYYLQSLGNEEAAREAAHAHRRVTHPGPAMREALDVVLDVLETVLNGTPLNTALQQRFARKDTPLVQHAFADLAAMDDAAVLSAHFSTACYVQHSVPAVLHLAHKYADDPTAALIASTNCGGDNVHRNHVLGVLCGAAHGEEAWPETWREGLVETFYFQ